MNIFNPQHSNQFNLQLILKTVYRKKIVLLFYLISHLLSTPNLYL